MDKYTDQMRIINFKKNTVYELKTVILYVFNK